MRDCCTINTIPRALVSRIHIIWNIHRKLKSIYLNNSVPYSTFYCFNSNTVFWPSHYISIKYNWVSKPKLKPHNVTYPTPFGITFTPIIQVPRCDNSSHGCLAELRPRPKLAPDLPLLVACREVIAWRAQVVVVFLHVCFEVIHLHQSDTLSYDVEQWTMKIQNEGNRHTEAPILVSSVR